MSLRAQQDYQFVSKYAQYIRDKKRRETYAEAVNRNEEMHLRKYAGMGVDDEIRWAFDMQRQKRVLGSQRNLQFGGPAVEKKNARSYNCATMYCDRPRAFQEFYWLLLCGCGVGVSIQKHHIAKLPKISKIDKKKSKSYIIEDSIEGWADSLGVLLSSYFVSDQPFPEYNGYNVEFIFSEIRPEGSPLSHGGKAPGPEPLKKTLELIRNILDRAALEGEAIRPIHAYDILMHASDSVLSGGIRRSASIILFSLEDEEMMNAKIGDWKKENPQRGRSNNSAVLLKDKTSFEDFEKMIKSTREFGEPGMVWSDNLEATFNPCVETGQYPVDIETGKSGTQFCNLTTINAKKCKTEEDFFESVKAATIIGTLQAGYTNFEYLGETSENITKREALLGVSMTGIMDLPDPKLILNAKTLKKGANIAKKVNRELAPRIGVLPAARICCSKPEGSGSLMLGVPAAFNLHHSKRYLRRLQGNKNETPLQYFKKHNPLAVEESKWSANNTDEIVTFCIEIADGMKTKMDMTAIEMLETVKLIQKNWVMEGMNPELCTKPWLKHNVSNTIHVRDNEWEEVTKYIYDNREFFAGVSLFSVMGDLDYAQAPNLAVKLPSQIVREYGDGTLMASGLIVDGLRVFDDLWDACEYLTIEGKALEEPVYSKEVFRSKRAFEREHDLYEEQKDWIRRVKQFSNRYLNGDIRKTTYLMKEVHNWKLWCDIKREWKDVDYTLMIEDEDNTKLSEEVACAGGACTI